MNTTSKPADHYATIPYGFEWGPFIVERAAHIDGRGWYLQVRTKTSKEAVQVRTSETGRTLRTWKTDHRENVIKAPDD